MDWLEAQVIYRALYPSIGRLGRLKLQSAVVHQPAPRERFSFGRIDDILAIYDASTKTAQLLNSTAAVVWLSVLDADRSRRELLNILNDVWPGRESDLTSQINRLLAEWVELGWIQSNGSGVFAMNRDLDGSDASAPRLQASEAWSAKGVQRLWSKIVGLSAVHPSFEIWGLPEQAQTAEFGRLTGFLGGLPDSTVQTATTRMAVLLGKHVELDLGGQFFSFPDVTAASALFNLHAIRSAYPFSNAVTTLHAAAVGGSSGSILLPAVSGSGKTTLTAHLVARGWRYAGDDLIGIARTSTNSPTLQVLPFPTALGIKDGSRDVLKDDYPELEKLDPVIYGRKHVRFVAVKSTALAAEDPCWRTPRALVFVSYTPEAECSLKPLTAREALCSLVEAGIGPGMSFCPSGFDLVIDLINALPRYELNYSKLDDAAHHLEQLL